MVPRSRLLLRLALLLSLSLAGVSGCGTVHVSYRAASAAPASGAGILPDSLWVEPRDGVRPLIRLIDRAQNTIFAALYILSDSRVMHALERAAAQGVEVDVLLEPHPFGLGTQPKRPASLLRAAGVAVRWTPPYFALSHAKYLVADDQVAVISTANFSRAAFTKNREFFMIDRNPPEVRQISNIFRADWDHLVPLRTDPNLVLAPDNARTTLASLLHSARHSIDIYAEELRDPQMEMLLGAETRLGVRVRVLLPPNARGPDTARVCRHSVAVHYLSAPYSHAKAMVVDGRHGFIGSENLSSASLDRNREVGFLVRGPQLRRIEATFAADWHASHSGCGA